MLHILLVTAHPEIFRSFTEGLSSDPGVCLEQVTARADAMGIVRAQCPHLVIVDSGAPDSDSLDLVREMISVNAMVNTAVVSPLSDADFHDKSEGLGVLCRTPVEPGKKEARELLLKLRAVIGPVG